MGFFNTFALKQMIKERYTNACKQLGIRPSSAELKALEDAAAAIDDGSERSLNYALDRFAVAVNKTYPQMHLGVLAVCSFGSEFPQYFWCIAAATDWEINSKNS